MQHDLEPTAPRKPLWCRYLVAYGLIGAGAGLATLVPSDSGNWQVLVPAGVLVWSGFVVFVCAVVHSLRVIARRSKSAA